MMRVKNSRAERCRRGKISFVVLLALPVLVMLFCLAVNAQLLDEAKTNQQTAADAAALAAMHDWVQQRCCWRLSDALWERARLAACRFTSCNQIHGKSHGKELTLQSDDVVFGTWDWQRCCVRRLDASELTHDHLTRVDTIRVQAVRSCERGNPLPLYGGRMFSLRTASLTTGATAYFDRAVIGFAARGEQIVPLAPLALRACDCQDLLRRDLWSEDLHPEDLAESPIRITGDMANVDLENDANDASASTSRPSICLLQIGIGDLRSWLAQLLSGVNAQQLRDFGRPFRLDAASQTLIVPGSCVLTKEQLGDLRSALTELRYQGVPRIWPIFSHIDAQTQMPIITGFVAAKLTSVADADDHGHFTLGLQAVLMATPTAITNTSRQEQGVTRIVNPTIGKVRLVQ